MSMAAMKTSQARQKSGKREAEEELFGKFSDGKQQKRIEKGLLMTEHFSTLNDRCFFMRANLLFLSFLLARAKRWATNHNKPQGRVFWMPLDQSG